MQSTVLILGAAGGFGRLLTALLTRDGFSVSGVDRNPPDGAPVMRADVEAPDERLLELVRAADWVIAAMPYEPTVAALQRLVPEMRAGAMFVDILSVKGPICALMEQAREDLELVSIHPMFAPAVGFKDQNVVVVRVRGGAHAARLEELLQRWQARVTELTAGQHDRWTALIQAATHFAILSFGAALDAMSYVSAAGLPLASPPHRLLLALLARIAAGDSATYWLIQRENPAAEEARRAFIDAADRLESIVREGDDAAFREMIDRIRRMLADANEPLKSLAAAAVLLS